MGSQLDLALQELPWHLTEASCVERQRYVLTRLLCGH